MGAPSRSSPLLPAATRVVTRPGTAATVLPRSWAKSAVISVPDDSLDHHRHPRQRRHDPVAGGKAPAVRALARGQLGDHEAVLAKLTVEVAVPPRIGDIRSAGENRDRGATGAEGPTVDRGVDSQRHAADHGEAGRRESATEVVGHVDPVGRRLPGSDDRHRRLLPGRCEQPVTPPAEERRRRVGKVPEAGRVAVGVPAEGADLRMLEIGAGATRLEAGEEVERLVGALASHGHRKLRVVEREQTRRARARPVEQPSDPSGEQADKVSATEAGVACLDHRLAIR
jgi:hypothetical protein